jgi:hypothetical protein
MKTGWCKFLPLVLVVVLIPCLCAAQTVKRPVQFFHTGTDSVGQRLEYSIKELIRQSQGLRLDTSGEGTTMVVILQTKVRDDKDPSVASIFHVTHCMQIPGTGLLYRNGALGQSGTNRIKESAEDVVASIDAEWQSFLQEVRSTPSSKKKTP